MMPKLDDCLFRVWSGPEGERFISTAALPGAHYCTETRKYHPVVYTWHSNGHDHLLMTEPCDTYEDALGKATDNAWAAIQAVAKGLNDEYPGDGEHTVEDTRALT